MHQFPRSKEHHVHDSRPRRKLRTRPVLVLPDFLVPGDRLVDLHLQAPPLAHQGPASAEGVLRERFAPGEIDDTEYRQRLEVLRTKK
ncbi:hypothetical protein [Glutamicibacter sp. AOP5-A2-18]|uniref:hypothetical protein n=1 Tax=Glutamicibacter sp. AOP5-A2-18 TaxID=3457656 RepID=UPI004034BFDB